MQTGTLMVSEGGLERPQPAPLSTDPGWKEIVGIVISELATLRTVSVHDKDFQITVTIAAEDDLCPIWL